MQQFYVSEQEFLLEIMRKDREKAGKNGREKSIKKWDSWLSTDYFMNDMSFNIRESHVATTETKRRTRVVDSE